MSDCGLETLQVDTFLDLVDLRWLDLSNNRLQVYELSAAYSCQECAYFGRLPSRTENYAV